MRPFHLWSRAVQVAGGASFVLAAALGLWAARALRDLPDVRAVQERTPAPSILIVDRSGRLLYEAINPRVGRHVPVPLERIPLDLRQATIATEDARFGHHPGVDVLALLRALWLNLRSGEVVSGGSTIPQQVARTLLLAEGERNERTLWRKVREAVLAWRLSRAYTSDEILELYLNQTYYGHYARGVEAAAQAYFGKHVDELDLAECALLAGLPQSPAQYNPLENPEAARVRQRVVLDLMVRRGYLTPEEARTAAAEPLRFAAIPFPIQAPHFVMYVQRLLEEQVDPAVLARGGLVVHTTLDLDLNREAERIIRRHLERLTAPEKGNPPRQVDNATLVALDPGTGEVLAMVGSPDYFDPRISGAVNGALALRQPGSAIKPLTYAAAFDPARATPERPPLTAATLVEDVLTSFVTREGDPYVPLNYDLEFHGPVLLRQALGSSLNIPAVKVLDYIGVETLVTLAHDLGIHSLEAGHRYGLALTLGGGEVSLLELTRAYAAFANGGNLPPLRAILRVEDLQGRVVWEPEPAGPRPILDPRVAYLITDILSDNYARLLGFGERSPLRLSRPAAAKTGTTTDWRDNWTLGYVPQLVVGVWMGNADGSPMVGVSGVDGAAPIWHDFMEMALRGQPLLPFVEPPGLVRVRVCAESGLLPRPSCPRQREELFLAGTEPRETCDLHLPAEATEPVRPAQEVEGPRALASAGSGSVPGAGRAGPERPGISLARPAPNSEYRLSPALPREHQRIPLTVHASLGLALDEVTLLVDGEVWAILDSPPYEAWWPLRPGEHRVQALARDQGGNRWETPAVAFHVAE